MATAAANGMPLYAGPNRQSNLASKALFVLQRRRDLGWTSPVSQSSHCKEIENQLFQIFCPFQVHGVTMCDQWLNTGCNDGISIELPKPWRLRSMIPWDNHQSGYVFFGSLNLHPTAIHGECCTKRSSHLVKASPVVNKPALKKYGEVLQHLSGMIRYD